MGFTETHQCYGETVTVNAKAKILMHLEKKLYGRSVGCFGVFPNVFTNMRKKHLPTAGGGAAVIGGGEDPERNEMNELITK